MLIGNRERFALELHPVAPSWEPRYEPEAAAWAGLGIWIGGKNLCAHVRVGEEELRTAVFVPLGPIADWFVRAYPGIAFEERPRWLEVKTWRLHDMVRKWGESPPPVGLDEEAWLDHREAFWSRHFLLAGADGAWLPNLCLLREDDEVALTWRTSQLRPVPPMTFLHAEGAARVAWTDVHAVLGRFVDEVAKAFEQRKVAPYPWIAAPRPRLHSDAKGSEVIALYCARPLQQVAELLEVQPEEVTSILGSEALDDRRRMRCARCFAISPRLHLRASERRRAPRSRSPWRSRARLRTRRGPMCAWSRATPLEQQRPRSGAGQLAARAVRRALALDGQPIGRTPDVLGELGLTVRASAVEANHEHMLVVAARGSTPVVTVLQTLQTRKIWGRRFEDARALGHALLDPLRGDVLGAAGTRWTQSVRRRRSGAFAAELLLPESVLVQASGGHLDGICGGQKFMELIERYGVGARTAAWQLYNHKLVSSQVRDELIERHADCGD